MRCHSQIRFKLSVEPAYHRLDLHAHLIFSWAVWGPYSWIQRSLTSGYISPTCFSAYIICQVPLDFCVCDLWFKYKRFGVQILIPKTTAAWIWTRHRLWAFPTSFIKMKMWFYSILLSSELDTLLGVLRLQNYRGTTYLQIYYLG